MSLKIVRLKAENIKKLVAVEITPDGNIVTITGKNGAGKTSVLDSIWWALAGTANIQDQPIRKGETRARIQLDLGELVVERKFTEAGSTLSVENADGARFGSPQKMLDALLGELSFDPLAFARMEPRKQFDELKRVSQLDVDVDKLDGLNRSDYAKRTDLNRDARAKRAQAEGIAISRDPMPAPIDEDALVKSLKDAGDFNADRERVKQALARSRQNMELSRSKARDINGRIAAMREEITRLEEMEKHWTEDADGLQKMLDDAPPLQPPIDTETIQAKITAARQSNDSIRRRNDAIARKEAITAEAVALELQANNLTASMAAREKAKTDAIARAKMPVEGLGFGDGHVTYNGIPFDQASSAEQLRVSLAIAMAANPKLRVIRIEDGSLLDEESMAAIAETAEANDYQVWIEVVDTSGTVGVVIADGMVKNQPSKEVATA